MVHAVHFNILKTLTFFRSGDIFVQFLLNMFFGWYLNSYYYYFYCYLDFDHGEMFAEDVALFDYHFYHSRCN